MRQITVGTSVVQLSPPGNRDFVAIFNNSSTVDLAVCFDGDDALSQPQISRTLTTGFSNSATVTALIVESAVGIMAGQLITGTGVPANTYVSAVIVDPVHETAMIVVNFVASSDSDTGAYKFGAAALTTSNGFIIPARTNLILSNDSHRNVWNKAIYGITASTADVRIQGS